MIAAIVIRFLVSIVVLVWLLWEYAESRRNKKYMEKMKRDIDEIAAETRTGLDEINELKRKENEITLD